MHSRLDAFKRAATRFGDASDDVGRVPAQERARKSEMKLLEELRRLRRDRAELATLNARARVAVAKELVQDRRNAAAEKHQLYRDSQDIVTRAVSAGHSSLEEIRALLDGVDRARGTMFQARTQIAVQISEAKAAEAELQKAADAARAAATAHEKVLEWKRSS